MLCSLFFLIKRNPRTGQLPSWGKKYSQIIHDNEWTSDHLGDSHIGTKVWVAIVMTSKLDLLLKIIVTFWRVQPPDN